MAKAWIITVELTDKSAPKKTVDPVSNRKKIAQVEEHLCELYAQLTRTESTDLKAHIVRTSGFLTKLEKVPYIIQAELMQD